MTTATHVELDQRTLDELAPPCESTAKGIHEAALHPERPACVRTADAIVRATCPRCGITATLLLCLEHTQRAVDIAETPGVCLTCHKPSGAWPCTVEPLR